MATETIVSNELGRGARSDLVALQFSPLLNRLHEDPRWDAWLAETNQQMHIEADYPIVSLLQQHLERHPELSALAAPDSLAR
jgi:hypothetical protein